LFNLLGPLANPAKPSHIMIGVYDEALLMPFARTLQLLGYQDALVVHGDGLDELALHGVSQVVEVQGEHLNSFHLSPEDFGLNRYPLTAIKGGEPEENKALIAAVLQGKGHEAHQAAVAMNAGALLKLCGLADSYAAGASLALESMQAAKPISTIELAASISQQDATP
jgi:anthranilate phosphoribosyltransferase